jgi:hypothetical protein
MMRSVTMLFLLLCITACMVKCAWSAELRTLEWGANPEAVTGYRLYKLPERMLLATTSATVASVPLEVGEVVALAAYTATAESPLSSPVTITATVQTLDKTGWTVAAVSSQETIREASPASKALDGDPVTFWHSEWDALPPHYLAIALPRAATVSRLDYLPRQDGNANGRIQAYEIQASNDGQDWQSWSAGTWADDATLKTATLPLRSIRYFRLWGNERFAAAAEINLRGTYEPEPPATVRTTIQRGSDLKGWTDTSTFAEFQITDPAEFYRLKIERP